MSFLFEKHAQKSKNQVVEKKRVSMDVRAPQSQNPHPLSFAGPQARPTLFRDRSPEPALRFRDVKPAVAPRRESQYAKRVMEMAQLKQAPKLGPVSQFKKITPARAQRFSFIGEFFESFHERVGSFVPRLNLSPNKLVYGSIMSGVAFGMVSLGLIEKTFESNANAAAEASPKVETVNLETGNYNPEKDVFMQYFSDAADAEYQAGVREMVKGYPIEEMLPYIFEKDRITAAFLIGIAKKESNWGKRRPVLDGQDCFNYWGYRGQRRLMGSGGHTCFNSRKDAVDTVAKRLDTLINSERLNTPAKLIVWKCGMSCEGHGKESVQKWISDVDSYYSEMMALESENTEIVDIEDDGSQ